MENQSNERINLLIETIDNLDNAMHAHGKQLLETERRSRWSQRVAIIGIIVGLLGSIVGAAGFIDAREAREETEEIVNTRTQSRVVACIRENVQISRYRDAHINSIRMLADDPSNLTDHEQALLDAYSRAVEENLPYRDCSPEGIEKHFSEAPKDPAVES